MVSQYTAFQLLISQAIMAWRYVEDPTVRLAAEVKRSVDDERCHNISRRNRGISWFLGVLFVGTTIVRAAQPSQTSNKGSIVINLGAMDHQSLRSRSLSDQRTLLKCLHCSFKPRDPDTLLLPSRESQLMASLTTDLASCLLFISCRALDDHHVAWSYYVFAVVFDIITTGIAMFYMTKLDAKSNL